LLENEKNFPEGTEIEYVFVDDGSTDNTFGELQKIQKLYPNFVHFIFKKSVGTQKDEYENFDKVFSSFPAGMSLFTFNWVD